MQKFLLLLFIFFISLYANDKQKFSVSYDSDYAPFSYTINNKPTGLLIDIYKEWAKTNNYNIVFVKAKSWEDAIDMAKNGKTDFFLGTNPYEDWMIASMPIYQTKTNCFKLKNSQKNDIRKLGIIGNDYTSDIKNKYPDIKISSFKDYDELIYALINKKIDAIYDDALSIETYLLQHQLNHLITIEKNFLSETSNIHAISNDINKIKIFNEGFEKIPLNRLKNLEEEWIYNKEQRYYSNYYKKLSTKDLA